MIGQPIILGSVVKPVGLRGEVKLRTTADFWEAALGSERLRVVHAGASDSLRVLRSRSQGPGVMVLALEGVTTREAAEAMVGAELLLEGEPADVAPPADLRSFQVRGMRVHTREGVEVGVVVDVMHLPAQDLLVVRGAERDHLIPHVTAIVIEIDRAARIIRIDPPAGLLEL